MSKEIQEWLAAGNEITILPASKEKPSLKFPKMGHKYSEYNVGRQRVIARRDAAKKAA